jgi:V-type H+-transporting ATPase subunit a
MNEIFRMCFGGRYLLVSMGIMGVYCGTLYNDCMSIPISLYPSTWGEPAEEGAGAPRVGAVYPYGVDPAWYHTKNQLTFFNGMKMKTSVIIGVTQMSFGIILSLFNHVHFKEYSSIFFEFIPQLTFMLCTFGYMCVLIIIKACAPPLS